MKHGVKLGDLIVRKVFELEDGLPMSMVMPGVSADDLARLKPWFWDETLADDPADASFALSIHSYVLQLDGRNILIDACNGNHKDRSIPFAHQLNTGYLDNLAAIGLKPEDIDLVLCTHLHADHVGWNTRLIDGRWVPTFPNARYLFGRRDYAFYSMQHHEAFHREAYLDSVLPVVEAGLADIVEEDSIVHRELGDGVWLEPAFGHSPGCFAINAQRGGPPALFSGDVVHHPIQLVRPDLHIFADEDPYMASATRLQLLNRVADTETVLFPAHFRYSSCGHVKRDGEAFRFEFLDA
ncbi:putative hydrolase [Sphingobium sp. SYK-6]|uniref:MBL fold metallo-hydrolase n=1 Tax=Sphingobium sp. (strain NBRC 103272 / SYK-6) TaxID=627192 RepID=UPI00022773C2|nr:MBL fold metallo-hydrolase [Sphingobium sp. SYK-6]BAK66532.1 putative hydrolase [Sphingobium sp. SYK-6]